MKLKASRSYNCRSEACSGRLPLGAPDPATKQHGAGLLRSTLKFVTLALLAALAAVRVHAQEPRFDIQRFVVEGSTLITKERIDAVLAPFAGKGRSFADVQRGLEALEKVYSALGYSAVQVILPEQELERGEVRFKVVEAKIGRWSSRER